MMIKFLQNEIFSVMKVCIADAIWARYKFVNSRGKFVDQHVRAFCSRYTEGSAVLIALSQQDSLIRLEGQSDPKSMEVDKNFDRLVKELISRGVRLPMTDYGSPEGLPTQDQIVEQIYNEKGWTRKFEVVKISRFMKKIWMILGAEKDSDFQRFFFMEIEPLLPIDLSSYSIRYGTNDKEFKEIIDSSSVTSCMKKKPGSEDSRDFSSIAASGCRYFGVVKEGRIVVRGQSRWCEAKGVWMTPAIYSALPEELALQILKKHGIVPPIIGENVAFDFEAAAKSVRIYDDFYGWLDVMDAKLRAANGEKVFRVWKQFEAKVDMKVCSGLYMKEKGCAGFIPDRRFSGAMFFDMLNMGLDTRLCMEISYSSYYDQDYDETVVTREVFFFLPSGDYIFEGTRKVNDCYIRMGCNIDELCDFLDEQEVDLITREWERVQGFTWRSRNA